MIKTCYSQKIKCGMLCLLFVFQICYNTSMAPPILKPNVNISLLKEDYFKEVWKDFSMLQVCKLSFSIDDVYGSGMTLIVAIIFACTVDTELLKFGRCPEFREFQKIVQITAQQLLCYSQHSSEHPKKHPHATKLS